MHAFRKSRCSLISLSTLKLNFFVLKNANYFKTKQVCENPHILSKTLGKTMRIAKKQIFKVPFLLPYNWQGRD